MFEDIILFDDEAFDLGFDAVHRNPNIAILRGGSEELNRKILENRKTDILLDPEPEKYDRLHHRNSGLNHVLCNLARKNNICIAFSFSRILKSKNRARLMGKIMQNIKLCRKYKVRMAFASFAENKWEMRSPYELMALIRCLGMTAAEAKSALNTISYLVERKRKTIREGVELAD